MYLHFGDGKAAVNSDRIMSFEIHNITDASDAWKRIHEVPEGSAYCVVAYMTPWGDGADPAKYYLNWSKTAEEAVYYMDHVITLIQRDREQHCGNCRRG